MSEPVPRRVRRKVMTDKGFRAWCSKNRAVVSECITEKDGIKRFNVVTRKGTPRTIRVKDLSGTSPKSLPGKTTR